MKIQSYISILLAASLLGCKKPKKMELPMPREQVVNLLADVHLVEQLSYYYKEANRDSMLAIYMDSVYKIHQVDSLQHLEIINLLNDNLGEYFKIEKEVHKKLKTMNKK